MDERGQKQRTADYVIMYKIFSVYGCFWGCDRSGIAFGGFFE